MSVDPDSWPSSARLGPARPGTAEVELDGRFSIYSARRDEVLTLNDTASDVWRLCDGTLTLEEITAVLATAYSTAPDLIAPDLRAVAGQFLDAGLIEMSLPL